MSERISRICDELRIKLHGLDRRLEALKSNGAATYDHSHDALESQLRRVERRIYDNRVAVEAAHAGAKAWLAEKRSGLHGIQVPRNERDALHRLEAEADGAETYAGAAFELAAAAADEAIMAVLQAIIARNRVDRAAFPEVDPPAQELFASVAMDPASTRPNGSGREG